MTYKGSLRYRCARLRYVPRNASAQVLGRVLRRKGRKPREDKLRVRRSAVRPPETSLPESDRESEDVGVSTRTFAGAGSERWAATRWLVDPGFARPP